MSEIETLSHEICGTLAGVPLYRVTEDYEGALAKPDEFSLGGGLGEHNQCTINIVGAVTFFLLEDEFEEVHYDMPRIPNFPFARIEALLKALAPVDVSREESDRWAWTGDEYAHFIKRAKRTEGFGRAYRPKRDGCIENWVLASIGEYALVARTDLVAKLISGRVAADVVDELKAFAQAVSTAPMYLNIMAFPTGYETVGGRRARLGDGNVIH